MKRVLYTVNETDSKKGLTLGDLIAFVAEVAAEGVDPETPLRVRSWLGANSQGSLVKQMTIEKTS